MRDHQKIISYSFIAFGTLNALTLASAIALTLSTPQAKIIGGLILSTVLSAVTAVLLIIAGLAMLNKKAWHKRVSVPAALTALISFPLGTALGAYYFWFHFIENKNSTENPPSKNATLIFNITSVICRAVYASIIIFYFGTYSIAIAMGFDSGINAPAVTIAALYLTIFISLIAPVLIPLDNLLHPGLKLKSLYYWYGLIAAACLLLFAYKMLNISLR